MSLLLDAAEAASPDVERRDCAARADDLPESMRAPAPPPLPRAGAAPVRRRAQPLPSLRGTEGEGVALPNELPAGAAHIQKCDVAGDPALALAQLQRQRELGAPGRRRRLRAVLRSVGRRRNACGGA
ncbi:MAG: hypothetical protein KF850_06890 [Labilithrix sp.]|nr:hypothetical protein [Labilithrix sp.]